MVVVVVVMVVVVVVVVVDVIFLVVVNRGNLTRALRLNLAYMIAEAIIRPQCELAHRSIFCRPSRLLRLNSIAIRARKHATSGILHLGTGTGTLNGNRSRDVFI